MKIHSFALAAALMIAGSAVFAQGQQQTYNIVVDEFVSSYTADGFTRFEVRVGITQVKIEAYRGDQKEEVILDMTSGKVLKTETGPVAPFDNDTAGVFIRERNRDFLRVDDDSNDDDEDGDDSDDDSSDDDSDDNSGGSDDSGDSNDDDSNDDNDGDRDGSDDSDDDSDDDNGGDDDNGDD